MKPIVEGAHAKLGHMTESYATTQDMAAKYRIADETVRRKVQTGEWPCDRIGRLYRFSPDQQDEIAQIIAGRQPFSDK